LNWKFLIAAVLVVLAASFAFACSSDDDDGDDNGNGDEPQATEVTDDATEVPDGGDGPGDSLQDGNATLTIGEETWTFDGFGCAFGPEETRNENVEFSAAAFGESATGASTQLSVDITLGTHAVSLNDIDDFENPSVALEAIGGFEIQIDGDNISAEALFDDGTTDEFDEIPGTFSGTC